MNLKKYKRFFAFGCSFTRYDWPTWADIIALEIPESYNYGNAGSGNFYIFSSMIEANIKHKFTKDDLIIVMWTGVDREDRYINNKWEARGCVYHSIDNFYDDDFCKKYVDNRGFFIRDLSCIVASTGVLQNTEYYFLSMLPLNKTEYNTVENDHTDLLHFYSETLDVIKPSVHEVIYNFDWMSIGFIKRKDSNGKDFKDFHPTPKSHLEYLQKTFPELNLPKSTIDFINVENEKIFAQEYFDPNKYQFNRKYINRL